MIIHPIKAFSDNYIWAIHQENDNGLIVVDPGDAKPVIAYINANGLRLDAILITHYHHDHIGGVNELKNKYHCPVYGSSYDNLECCDHYLSDQDRLNLWSGQLNFELLHVPGHTLGHIAYHDSQKKLLFCGDTLFRAGCGRMFEGEPEQFYHSLQTLAALAQDTQVYCTHEYTLSNLAFAQHIEPSNHDTKQLLQECKALREKGLVTLPSYLASELKCNPFLRCHIPSVSERVKQLANVNVKKEYEIFASMRRLKDNF